MVIKTRKVKYEDLPYVIRKGYPRFIKSNDIYYFGNTKPHENRFAIPEERQMANHYGVMFVMNFNSHVIRDDNTVWYVDLEEFESVERIEVIK